MEEFIDTWRISNRINFYLLDAVEEAHLSDISSSKGRNVGQQFAHMHNVRLMWLKASAPELLEGLNKIETKTPVTRGMLREELEKSGNAISQLLKIGFETGKVKNFKPHPAAFFGYMLAHEAHHRGQIMLCLKQSGHPVDQKTQYGMWEWGTR